MPDRAMLDTDVVIDYLRRQPDAVRFVKGLADRPFISVVTVGELYAGVRDGRERSELEIVVGGFRVIRVTREIAVQAGLHRRAYGKSHNVQLADALIAACSQSAQARLYTLNTKHFPMLANVTVPYTKA